MRPRDSHSLGRGGGERRIINVLATSSELASGTGCQLGGGADGRAGLGGSRGGIVGFTLLGGHQERIKGVMLAGVKGVGWKGIAFVCDLCLRGKVGRVGGRTLMVLNMVSPVVVLAQNRLRVASGSRRG